MRPVSAHRDTRGRRAVLIAAWSLFALIGTSTSLYAQSDLKVIPLVKDDHVLVSFDLMDGFTNDVRAAIGSGLKTTFTYNVDLRESVSGWVDRTMGTTTVTSSVEYDNLTRRYTVDRVIDGKTVDHKVLEDENIVRTWLTNLVRLPLFSTTLLEPNREYYVRVRATARPSNGSILWPFGSSTSAQAKFTFIR